MLRNAPVIPYIPVADVKRARAFYERTLDLVPREENDAGVVYDCGQGTQVFLYKSASAGTNKASCAFWAVADLDAEMKALRAKGVIFEEFDLPGIKTQNGVATGGGAKIAWFKDPDGNIMALSQRLR